MRTVVILLYSTYLNEIILRGLTVNVSLKSEVIFEAYIILNVQINQ